jgi:hypothetical protein
MDVERRERFGPSVPLSISASNLLGFGGAVASLRTTFQTMMLTTTLVISRCAEPGRITGIINGPNCDGGGAAVWAVTSDCRRSYRTVQFQGDRFILEAIPPGSYKLVGYCFAAYTEPTPEFQVERGVTVEKNVSLDAGTLDGSDIPKGITPLNGRIVDDAGRRVEGATVTASVSGGLWGDSVTGVDGRFGYCALPPGKLSLVVKHPDYRTKTVKFSLGIFNYSSGQLEIKLGKR